MSDKGKERKKKKIPRVAPGFSDDKFGESATADEIQEGKSTRVTRVYLDENDPS